MTEYRNRIRCCCHDASWQLKVRVFSYWTQQLRPVPSRPPLHSTTSELQISSKKKSSAGCSLSTTIIIKYNGNEVIKNLWYCNRNDIRCGWGRYRLRFFSFLEFPYTHTHPKSATWHFKGGSFNPKIHKSCRSLEILVNSTDWWLVNCLTNLEICRWILTPLASTQRI